MTFKSPRVLLSRCALSDDCLVDGIEAAAPPAPGSLPSCRTRCASSPGSSPCGAGQSQTPPRRSVLGTRTAEQGFIHILAEQGSEKTQQGLCVCVKLKKSTDKIPCSHNQSLKNRAVLFKKVQVERALVIQSKV